MELSRLWILKNSPEKKIGMIPLVNFQNPEGLEQGENKKLKQTDESGKASLIKDHNRIAQMHLKVLMWISLILYLRCLESTLQWLQASVWRKLLMICTTNQST